MVADRLGCVNRSLTASDLQLLLSRRVVVTMLSRELG